MREAENGDKLANAQEYQELVDSLNHAAVYSRPDIANAVSNLSRYLQKPTMQHLQEARHTLCYLYTTRNLQITYGDAPDINIYGFADANWGGDINTRKSTTGYVFITNNGPISWTSRRQTTVALSTMEAEYMALSDATREAIAKRQIMQELRLQILPPLLHCDNQGAITIAENPVHYQRSKHIDIRYHFIRHALQTNQIALTYIPTKSQIADVLTKALGPQRHHQIVHKLFAPQTNI